VASLLACLVLIITRQEEKLEEGIDEVRMLTSRMVGPSSTQNRTQWAHISNAATSILETLGISMPDADAAVRDRYGDSAIEALLEIRGIR
jgi:hypothetical protein